MLCLSIVSLVLVATCATTSAFTNSLASYSASSNNGLAFLRRSHTALSMKSGGDSWDFPEETPRRTPQLSDSRRERLQIEASAKSRFVTGDSLHSLRKEVLELREELSNARELASPRRVQELEQAILEAQQVDAEFIYSVALERMEEAKTNGNLEAAEKFKAEAMAARSCLPQFNLEGLWVGKYGDHGYEMINVTYIGDTLVAHKVTGAKNVPKGEPTFQVDLNPKVVSPSKILKPIELTDAAINQWGTKHLSRFAGVGHVAGEGYVNSQWLEGQLILVGEYFSFAWLPLGHQVFFGRPSPELTLKMLKEIGPAASDKARYFLERCMEETHHVEDEVEVNDGLSYTNVEHGYFNQEGCFE